MTLEQLIALGMTEEVAKKVLESYQATIKDQFVPIARFNQVNDTKKQLEEDIKERDKQLKELKANAKGNEELEKKIMELQEANKKAKEEYEKTLNKQQKDFAIIEALRDAGAKNQKAVMALLDLDTVKVDGKDLLGLKEQLEKLKESDSYLFGEGAGVGGRDPHPPGKGGKETSKNPWGKEHYNLTEQGRILREDPELAKQFMAQV